MMGHPKDRVVQGKGKKKMQTPTLMNDAAEVLRRPVACAWCVKRVDTETENWEHRPEKIRIGEERGRMWIVELERRRLEKEAEIAETVATDLAAIGAAGAANTGRLEGVESGEGSSDGV